jgi:hypothetical protein
MHDTSADIIQKINEMIQEKTGQERLMMGCSMYETSKTLITQAILKENPQISKVDFKQEFFLKFYGDDFNPIERARILEHIKNLNP